MLRNFKTKQYIRCRLTQPGGGQCIGYVDHESTRAHPLRLDILLLICIWWSTAIHSDIPDRLHKAKGDWVGHLFDIVSREDMDMANDAWEDVTDEKVKGAVVIRETMKQSARLRSHHQMISEPVQTHLLTGAEAARLTDGELHPVAFDTLPTVHLPRLV